MQETKTIRVKKCPYCFRNISNEDAGFLLRTDGVRFQSPALNEVFSYKTDTAYLYFWSAMGIPEEQIDAKRIIIDNEVMTELNQELTAAGRDLAVNALIRIVVDIRFMWKRERLPFFPIRWSVRTVIMYFHRTFLNMRC